MTTLLGLRNGCFSKEDTHYLIFYDIDRPYPISKQEMEIVDSIMRLYHCSYLIYNTKHGQHIIGLTPLDCETWAFIFGRLKLLFKSYYLGLTIRLSRKENEVQELIQINTAYGEVIPNLYNLYCDRFNMQKLPWTREGSKYVLMFEKYRSLNK